MKTTRPTIYRKATLGIDLGDRKHAVCALNAKGGQPSALEADI